MMTGSHEGAARALEALLRVSGSQVQLRVPAPAAMGDDTEQLGLATPGFADIELGRGMVHKANRTAVLLIAASTVAKAIGPSGLASAEALFAHASGVLLGEKLYRIQDCEPLCALDGVFGYSMTLAAPEQ